MKGFIIYSDYSTEGESTFVKLFGKLENGQSFVTLNKVEPYFFIKEKDEKEIKKLLSKYKVEPSKLTTFDNNKVIKISHSSQSELNKLSSFLHEKSIETFESDIRPHLRFIIDNNLLGSIEIKGDSEPSERIDKVYKNPDITPVDFHPKLKVASIDIESSKSGELYCIGIYTENKKINLMITDKKLENTISCKDEEDCLEKFKQEILKIDPDIITGWNMIDFDLAQLQEKFKKHKIPLQLDVSDFGTTDALNIAVSKKGVPATAMTVPVRNLHTTIGIVDRNDINYAVKLLYLLLKNPPKLKL